MQEELLSCNELCGDVLLHSSVLKTGAGLYRAQLMPSLLNVSFFNKIQIVFIIIILMFYYTIMAARQYIHIQSQKDLKNSENDKKE